MLCSAVQGLLDKHGRENDKTPKGWKDGYHDLTPKSMKAAGAAAAAAAAAEGENGSAAAASSAGEEAASPDGEKKKKKKKKDKVGETSLGNPPFSCVCFVFFVCIMDVFLCRVVPMHQHRWTCWSACLPAFLPPSLPSSLLSIPTSRFSTLLSANLSVCLSIGRTVAGSC